MSKDVRKFYAYICPGCDEKFLGGSSKPKLHEHLDCLERAMISTAGVNQMRFEQWCLMHAALYTSRQMDVFRQEQNGNAVGSLNDRIVLGK